MIGLVVVSHSRQLAEGVVELAREMADEKLPIIAAGGMYDGTIGTDATMIMAAIEKVNRGDGVIIFGDLGSSILSAQLAIELLEDEVLRQQVHIVDAPLVEGSIVAAIQISVGDSIEDVVEMSKEVRNTNKL